MRSEPLVCSNCGAPLIPGDKLCPFCGELVGQAMPPPGPPLEPPPAMAGGGPGVAEPPVAPPLPSEEQIAAAGTAAPAWEDRKSYGFMASLWITWRESVFRPVEFFRTLPPRGGIGPALGFAVLFSTLGLIMNIYWATVQSALSGSAEEGLGILLLGGLFVALLWLAFAVPLYVGLLFAMAGVLHVCFIAVGAGRRGFEATFRAIGYSAGPAAFAVFPFFGPLISLVWGTVVLFIGLREVQRTTNGKATLAFLLPLFALTLLVILLIIILAVIFAGAGLGTLE
ncbi:MAG: YIP1 family protein [Gemmatimonadota bacterium]|nr:MAG: YIP1 family protein [Gemmatimonadota bacterium]